MPSTLLLLKSLALASLVDALPKKRDSKTVHLDVFQADKAVNGKTVDAPFTVSSSIYYVEVTLGTPPQTIYSQLDTGSSNLVVYPPRLALAKCTFSQAVCDSSTYTDTASSTYVNLTIPYSSSYGDGSGGSGFLATDTLNFEGAVINAFEFVDQTVSNTLGNSVFGTGYASNEGVNPQYNNLPLRLTADGYINSPVFSLWLNSLRSSNPGSMLYGGIDNQKYCGSLTTLPIQQTNGGYTEFTVALGSIVAQGPNGNSQNIDIGSNTLALLDSGTNSISVSQTAYNEILALYNASPAQGNGFPQVACSLGNSGLTMSFGFGGGLVIPVPLDQIVAAPQNNDQQTCDFFVSTQPAGAEFILGSSFLSAAYVVYDIGNNEIHMAPAIFNPTSSNVITVGSGPNAVPSVAGPACSSSSTTTTTTTTTTTSATSTMTSSTTTTSSSAATTTTTGSSSSTTTSTSSRSTSTGSTTAASTTTSKSSSVSASTTGKSSASTTTTAMSSASTSTATTSTWSTTSASVSGTSSSWSDWDGKTKSSSTTSKTVSPATSSSTSMMSTSSGYTWADYTTTASTTSSTTKPVKGTTTSTTTSDAMVWPDWSSASVSGTSSSTKSHHHKSKTVSVATSSSTSSSAVTWSAWDGYTMPASSSVTTTPAKATSYWTGAIPATTTPVKATSYWTGAIPAKSSSSMAMSQSWLDNNVDASSTSTWADAVVPTTMTVVPEKPTAVAASSWADTDVDASSTSSVSSSAAWSNMPVAPASATPMPAPVKPYTGGAARFGMSVGVVVVGTVLAMVL
ncbi:putative aspartic-type endopeptidase OPSB [Cyphellophora attinorum]|uniref:Putative aspartic-type endopeptidase OPSB n=1 Tax=Cyphellophora attinorum TaxID=1664694 RepID=A0A0N0NRF6_9EURO|nr:putative aspartic-type endopeptidase OPSB [Phialophora attinorum]KPI45038.1 putative aspartic-type endopeptidase OPSB [Phialophora attinorum]